MPQCSPCGAASRLFKRNKPGRTTHALPARFNESGAGPSTPPSSADPENFVASPSENVPAVPENIPVSENPAPSPDDRIGPTDQSSSKDVPDKRSGICTVGYGIETVFQGVYQASDAFPPLKSALAGFFVILNNWRQVTGNEDAVKAMEQRLRNLHRLIPELRSGDPKDLARREGLEKIFNPILRKLEQMKGQDIIEKAARSTSDQKLLSGYIDDIRDALVEYRISLLQELRDIMDDNKQKTDLALLEPILRAKEASFQSGDRPSCIRGTRTAVLLEITKWVEEPGDHPLYYLCGNAGCGKSTIAQTLAKICFAKGLLGASFFCSRRTDNLSNIKFIFPTLAFQLANRYPEFRADLVSVIKGTRDAGHQSPDNQLQTLLIGPLTRIRLSTLIIIDALDECKDDKPESAILSLLAKHIKKIPKVRFLITSRPDTRIYHGHHFGLLDRLTDVCLLHEIKKEVVDDDIKLYLEGTLSNIVTTKLPKLPDPWPSSDELAILGDICSGLFICASTLVKLIELSDDHPQTELKYIIDHANDTTRIGQWELNGMYRTVMERGFLERSKRNKDTMAKVRLVIGSIVLMFNPIPRSHLATLLGMSSDDIYNRMCTLSSVLDTPDSDTEPVRVYHKSFPDFIKDLERCKDKDFYIDPSYYHGQLAIRCLKLMITKLTKTNICDLPRYTMNSDIEDLPALRAKRIGDGLEYACTFWARHLRLAVNSKAHQIPIASVLELLDSFANKNLLVWLEILTIIKELPTAVYSLLDVQSWLREVAIGKDVERLLKLFEDAQRFVLRFTEVIQESASHIYESALFWTPTSSLVRKAYSNQIPEDLRLLTGTETEWDTCYCSFAVPDARVVVFSYSSGKIAVGGEKGFLRIYDAVTGVCQVIFKNHDDDYAYDVNSVAFTPKDDFVVSGSNDGTVRIWNVQTGSLTSTLFGDTGRVQSVAVSSAGDKIVSGGDYGTILVWNILSKDFERINAGDPAIYYVNWLGSTSKFVSGGRDGVIKLWDSLSGKCIKTFQDQDAYEVASSGDGSKIAYCVKQSDKIVIQNTKTTKIVATFPSQNDYVNSLDFSSDGTHIVVSGNQRTVVRDLKKKSHVSIFEGISGAVSFSPNGKSVALGCDGSVRVFQLERGDKSTATFDCHSSAVKGLQFFSDGQFLASHSQVEIKIWDCKTGSCILILSSENWKDIRHIQVSHDSKFVAIVDDAHAVYLWDLHERQQIWSQHIPSEYLFGQIAFSPDDKHILCIRYNSMTLLDVESGRQVAFLQHDYFESFRVFFPGEDTIITHNGGRSQQWRIALKDNHNSNDLPMIFLPVAADDVVQPAEIGKRKLDSDGVWILDKFGRRVCWIPHGWRFSFYSPKPSVSHGHKFALGTGSGRVCVLDFSEPFGSQAALT